MTTNAGAEFKSSSLGFNSSDEVKLAENVDRSLKQFFKPEFLNRIDEIVTFSPLTREQLRQIIDLMLRDITERIAERGAKLTVTDAAKEVILDEGYDVKFGARPLKRAIQRLLEDKLASFSLHNEISAGTLIVVDAKDKKLDFTLAKM